MDWQTIPLTSIMEEVGQALQISLSRSGITLNIKVCKIEISVDKELFKSLIYNLIDNAIKASKSGQQIEVFAEETNGVLTISVKDHGIGIPKEEINKIMQPFYMIDKSRTRKAGEQVWDWHYALKLQDYTELDFKLKVNPERVLV